MAIEFNDIEDLIGKVLSNEASPEEIREVENWRKASQENEKYYADMQIIFAKAASIDFNADEAWLKVQKKLTKSKTRTINWQPLRIAAGIVLLVTAGIFVFRSFNRTVEQMAFASQNTIIENTLPDSSKITLNKNSSIEFKYDPKEKTRKVKLKGEGFFSVKHEETKPFVIETDETLVRDIGTSFNIKSYPEKDTVEVVVTEGVVQFYTLKDPGLMINAGETGIYSKRNKAFTKIARADTNKLAYKTRVFSFHSTDLRSVIEQINEVYDSKIKLANEDIARCQLTVTFRNDELDTMIEVITETLGLTAERKGKKEIILNGPGCQ